jgi:hypothetical protein
MRARGPAHGQASWGPQAPIAAPLPQHMRRDLTECT